MLFEPLEKVLKQREELTAGARKAADESLAAAERKAAGLRSQIQRGARRSLSPAGRNAQAWLEDQAKQVAAAHAALERSDGSGGSKAGRGSRGGETESGGNQRGAGGSDRDRGAGAEEIDEARVARHDAALAERASIYAQEKKSRRSCSPNDEMIVWKWANFVILAAGLGYLLGKTSAAVFQIAHRRKFRRTLPKRSAIKQDAEKTRRRDGRAAAVAGRGYRDVSAWKRRPRWSRKASASARKRRSRSKSCSSRPSRKSKSAGKIARRELQELRREAGAGSGGAAGSDAAGRRRPKQGLVDDFIQDLRAGVEELNDFGSGSALCEGAGRCG